MQGEEREERVSGKRRGKGERRAEWEGQEVRDVEGRGSEGE